MADFFHSLSKAYLAIYHYHAILKYFWLGLMSLKSFNRLNAIVRTERREREGQMPEGRVETKTTLCKLYKLYMF
jgi:hypothetical protein